MERSPSFNLKGWVYTHSKGPFSYQPHHGCWGRIPANTQPEIRPGGRLLPPPNLHNLHRPLKAALRREQRIPRPGAEPLASSARPDAVTSAGSGDKAARPQKTAMQWLGAPTPPMHTMYLFPNQTLPQTSSMLPPP